MENNLAYSKKKNPWVAAGLSFVFGPFGFLYLGWRYAISGLIIFTILVLLLTILDLPSPGWIKWALLPVVSWKAYAYTQVRNQLVADEGGLQKWRSFPLAMMAMSDLLVGLGMAYAGAISLWLAVKLILDGSILTGIAVLLLGAPLVVWVAAMLFGIVALGIDALFARGVENLFRE